MTAAAETATFRLPRSTYLAVLFLLLCTAPFALSAQVGDEGSTTGWSWRVVFFLIPIVAAVFIARTATFASPNGLRVRAAFGSRTLSWEQVRGLSVTGNAVYAVVDDGSVRLPCVGTKDLATISKVSGGRLPKIAEPLRKFAPGRRRRRYVRRS
ncbi:MAG TPA: PH domain-containing protein [Jatrophihabitans sp.]|jgi:hypothetical protein